jgi:hypothetical protein
MSNKAAYGPGGGPIGFERVGPWRTDPTDPIQMGAPFIFPVTSGTFKSEYGVLYKITLQGGGSNNGGAGGWIIAWWVGTGGIVTIAGGGLGVSSTFTVDGKTLLTATGSVALTGGSPSVDASFTGKVISGQGGAGKYDNFSDGNLNTVFVSFGGNSLLGQGAQSDKNGTLIQSSTGYGAGGNPFTTNGGGGSCAIIEKVLPALNSQAAPWQPGPPLI